MRRVIISTLALAVIVAGCSSEQEGTTTSTGSDGSAIFSTTISRVGDTQWESGDQVGLMVTKDNAIYDAATYKYNALYDAAPDGSLTPNAGDPDNKFYYPLDGTDLDFYAYYPYSELLNATDESYPIDLSDQSIPTKLDFMEASTRGNGVTYSKSNPNVSLTFNRRMAKLTFIVEAGEQVELSNITSISMEGFYTEASYSMSENSFELIDNVMSITPYEGASSTYSALLIPMEEANGDAITEHESPCVIFYTDLGVECNDTVTWVLGDYDIILKAGQHNIYTVRINHDGVIVSGGIGSWDSSESEELIVVEN
ncbi:MAG: fimbrillin family protein [Rikenellaceae bacterium]